ncbi:ABC transporter substrate-binding protein [Glycomyces sp. NPDC021274]|uniref:ABC transporter substrate-binding protein n=1 Tax=Glycomyces sp. NPDC021274 TaxID=3155120 RepID=UPI0033FD9388
MPNAPTGRFVAALCTAAALAAVAACSETPGTANSASDDGTGIGGGATEYPLTIENCGSEVTFEAPPEKVVIMNGASVGEVESLLTLGLEDAILANVQSYGMSEDPAMVERIAALPDGGLTVNENFDVPAEQMLALEPDLVISTAASGFDPAYGFAPRDELAAVGANTLIHPANCALGAADATAEQREALENATVEDSFAFLRLLGKVFDVQDEAEAVVTGLSARIDAVESAVEGVERPTALIVYPGMSMMNANGLPAVMSGGIFDDVLHRAGTVNSFAGDTELTASLSQEQLAAADVDLLVVGGFTPGEDLDAAAQALFDAYPDWAASQTGNYVTVSDGVYLGPLNALAIEKIAQRAHPDRF